MSAVLSPSCLANNDSVALPRLSWASPRFADEEPHCWAFCRLSLLRSMVYSPLLLVRAFVPRFRLRLSVAPPFGLECLTSLADVGPTMPSADFCILQTSQGKFSRLPRTVAGSTLRVLDGYGLCRRVAARPTLTPLIRFLFIDSHRLLRASFRLPSRR